MTRTEVQNDLTQIAVQLNEIARQNGTTEVRNINLKFNRGKVRLTVDVRNEVSLDESGYAVNDSYR